MAFDGCNISSCTCGGPRTSRDHASVVLALTGFRQTSHCGHQSALNDVRGFLFSARPAQHFSCHILGAPPPSLLFLFSNPQGAQRHIFPLLTASISRGGFAAHDRTSAGVCVPTRSPATSITPKPNASAFHQPTNINCGERSSIGRPRHQLLLSVGASINSWP